jgi:hypothetical protein
MYEAGKLLGYALLLLSWCDEGDESMDCPYSGGLSPFCASGNCTEVWVWCIVFSELRERLASLFL